MAGTTWSTQSRPFEAACVGGEGSAQRAVDSWSQAVEKSLCAQETSLTPSTSSGSSSSTEDPFSKGLVGVEAEEVEDQQRPYEALDDAHDCGEM